MSDGKFAVLTEVGRSRDEAASAETLVDLARRIDGLEPRRHVDKYLAVEYERSGHTVLAEADTPSQLERIVRQKVGAA